MRIIEGKLAGAGLRFCIVSPRSGGVAGEGLLIGAKDALLRHEVSHHGVDIVRTPGVWEAALAAKEAAITGRYDAIIVLGALCAGEREYLKILGNIASVGLAQRVPVTFGFQAASPGGRDRDCSEADNEGFKAAVAAIEMANLLRQMRNEKGDVLDA